MSVSLLHLLIGGLKFESIRPGRSGRCFCCELLLAHKHETEDGTRATEVPTDMLLPNMSRPCLCTAASAREAISGRAGAAGC
jgi:hypothetical protein